MGEPVEKLSLRGAAELTLDDKGRMAIPARYREELMRHCGGEIVVTVDYTPGPYLFIYPRPQWETFQARLMELTGFDDGVRMVQRRMLGYAMDTTMDGQGRILISPTLRKEATLDKNTVLIGQNNRFELWNESAWQERNAEVKYSAELLDKLSSLAL
ncbi:MAG: MraZ protein [Halothiobacillaceae bacterium]|nr:MAG: MraZ protein [Halothiobacillaceae bacterium]